MAENAERPTVEGAWPKCPECGAVERVHWEAWRSGWWCGPCGAEWPCGCQIERTASHCGIEFPLSAFALSRGMVTHSIVYCLAHALGPEMLLAHATPSTVGRAR